MVGKTLSHYKIIAELGRGGMGIVYKAEDTKLDRTVAIKVLPSAALSSEDDRARFYREAKAAAQLHHPHIASVFEIDEAVPEGSNSDDVRPFIAMEFIDGETLDARIKKGPLKLSEAVRIAGEIAEALKAAHGKDIVHRDIKSANVMLDADGRAKVLDFGLAQTAQSTKLTRMGSTLGTMSYMSPEQARGEEVDFRTDVWALGAVLYETVSGRLPFPGDYEQAVVYSILNEDPEALTAVRTGVPMSLERVVDKCLAKSAERRYQSLSDFIVDLKGVSDEISRPSQQHSRTGAPVSMSSGSSAPGAASADDVIPGTKRPSTGAILGGGIALGLAIALLAVWYLRPFGGTDAGSTTGTGTMRLELTLPESLPLAFVGSAPNSVGRTSLALTQDGSTLIYVAERSETTVLVRHHMDSNIFDELPGTEGAHGPVLSPGGEWIVFGAEGEMKKIRLDGGAPVSLAQFTDGEGFLWSSDGWIYFGDQQGRIVKRVPENGGQVETMISLSRGFLNGILPNGRHIIVTNFRENRLELLRVSDAEASLLPVDGASAVLAPTGHLLYAYRGRLLTVVFDASTLSARGGAIPLIDDLRTESILMQGQYSLSNNGILAYASGAASDVATLVWLEPGGMETPIDQPEAAYGALSVSPAGDRIAIVVNTVAGREIQVMDLRTGIRKPLTQSGSNGSPTWSSDGRDILFSGLAGEGFALLTKNPDSAGSPDTLVISEYGIDPYAQTADGKTLVVAAGEASGKTRLWALSMDDFEDRTAISQEGDFDWGPNLSQDGRLIAYTSITGERSEIRVQPFPPTGERWTISSEGGEEPIFLSSGSDLVYRNGRQWMIVSFETVPTFSASAPRLFFEGPYINVPGFEFDVGPDDRLLLLRPISDAETTGKLNVIVNWFDELKRLAPVE